MKVTLKYLYILTFLTILLLPSIGLYFNLSIYETCENRTLKEEPDFKWSTTYISEYEAYYNDHYGFRNLMNYWIANFKYTVFNTSIHPDKVVLGSDDWFFYASLSDKVLYSYAHDNLFSSSQLDSLEKNWSKRAADLKTQNIAYYSAVWPNKSTIYAEFVPFQMQMQQKHSPSRIDQAKSFLKKVNSPSRFLDVRDLLLNKKKDQIIYLKHDTHWNELGAFYGYQKLCAFMNLIPFKLDAFHIRYEHLPKGDLKGMLGLCQSSNVLEKVPFLVLKDSTNLITEYPTLYPGVTYYEYSKNKDAEAQTILVFRDSYTTALIPFITLHYQKAYFIAGDYNPDIVEKIKPDVVLVSKVERYF